MAKCIGKEKMTAVKYPDAYSGAVRTYDLNTERDYTVHGRCQPGEPLRILVPCWRLHGAVVVRGEAEPL